MAISASIKDEKIESIRIGVGSVAPTVVRAMKTEAVLTGRIISESSLKDAANLLRQDISPIDDIRSTALYRTTVASNIMQRMLKSFAAQN
jgi:xanthine dehydrogenase iron-sulfur cluster and FAD-binding subunit A